MGMGQFKKRGNAKSPIPITAVITAVITAREYYREAPWKIPTMYQGVCVCVCVVIPFILDVMSVDAPAGITREEGHTGCLHSPSAVLALKLIAILLLL